MKPKKREPAPVVEKIRRREKILYGEGRAIEPDDEPLDSIAQRLAGNPPTWPAAWPDQDSVFIHKFLARHSSELKTIAESKAIEAEVIECSPGKPVVFDLSSGIGLLDPSEPSPPGLRAGSRVWVAVLNHPDAAHPASSAPATCSIRIARAHRALTLIESVWAGRLWIEGAPTEHVPQEGWMVDIDGFRAVMPESESEGDPAGIQPNVPIRFFVLHYDSAQYLVVLSRKKYLERDRLIRHAFARKHLLPGQIHTARVVSVTPTAAWVDLDGVQAELSGENAGHGAARENLSALKVGQTLKVFLLDVTPEKIIVGSRQLTPDPWVFIKKTIQPGMKVQGTVKSVHSDHVKVDLGDGFTGDIPWKEAGWQIAGPGELEYFFHPGTAVETVCLSIQRETAKIVLSIKSLQPDPLPEIQRRYPIGHHCEVQLVSCDDACARVVTDDGYYGLILPEDLSWNGPVSPKHFFSAPVSGVVPASSPAKRIQVEVLAIDSAARQIRFGVKQVKPDPFVLLVREIEVGKPYEGRVVKIIGVGALVEIRKGLVGLLRKSDYAESEPPPHEGQTLQVMVLNIQKEQHRIALSRRAVVEQEERRAMQPFLSTPQDERKVRMKDILQGDALKRFFEKREQ